MAAKRLANSLRRVALGLSLKSRLRISILSIVTALVAVHFLGTVRIAADAHLRAAAERSQSIAIQVRNLLLDRLNRAVLAAAPPPATLEESVALWTAALENDPTLTGLLEKLVAGSPATVEIQICDEVGRILASSGPAQPRSTYRSIPDFETWSVRTVWDRLIEILTERREYSTVVPLGVPPSDRPIFTIRVIVSSVLLRSALMPQIQDLAVTSALTLLAAVLLAVFFSNSVHRALDRLGRRIERMAAGDLEAANPQTDRESAEFAAVSSKLNLLGEQFRDAVQVRGNIDHLLRRIEVAVLLFGPGRRLVLAGQPAERLLRRSRDSMIGKPIEEIFPPSTVLGAAILKALDEGKSLHDLHAVLEHPGQRPHRLLVTVEPLENLPGLHQLGTLITLQDIESRHQLRSQLDVSSRLTAISRLTGGVAHEIKNPLNAIALHLEVLKAKLGDVRDVDSEVEVIEREISRLDRVVKTFLDFARPVELSMGRVDLVALLSEIAALVGPEAGRNGVEVRLETDVGKAVIQADADLLKQAILNVVVNGIEAMKRGGRLTLGLIRSGDDFQVTVADQGTGIPQELQGKVFNLYFTTKDKGTGIGLAMTFRIIQLHEAAIDFTSQVGRGTTFRLRFPAADEFAASETPSSKSQPEGLPLRTGL